MKAKIKFSLRRTVFLTYSHADNRYVDRVYKELIQRDLDVYYDKKSHRPRTH